jgi:predicted ATP-dependent serine protease
MAELMAMREAIKTTIEANITGMKVYTTLPNVATVVPATLIEPNDSDFHQAMARGTDKHEFTLLVLVSYNDLEVAQHNLDPYISGSGGSSIREVIFNNRDLGVEGWNASVGSMFDYGMRFSGQHMGRGHEQFGARLSLTVYTRGYS